MGRLNDRLLIKISAVLLAIVLGGIVLHAPLSVFFESRFPEFELLIKSWKELVLGAALALEIVIVTHRQAWRQIWSDLVIKLIAVYAALHVALALLIGGGLTRILAGLVIDLRYVLLFVLVWTLVKIAPDYRRWLLGVLAAGAVVVVGFGVLQLFLPADVLKHLGYSSQTIQPFLTVDRNPDFVRINSTLRGPNPLGAYVLIVLTVLASIAINYRHKLSQKQWVLGTAFAAMSLVVLWVTYSRSALVGALLALAIIGLLGIKVSKKYLVLAGFGLAVIVLIGVLARDSTLVANVIFHDNPTTGAAITSDEAHASSLVNGTERLLRQPLGAGIGSTGSASLLGDETAIIENQYLFVAHETGWLGLGLFAAIFGMVLLRLYRLRRGALALAVFASGIGLAAIGLIQPVWADDTVALVWWGLAAVVLGSVQLTHHGRQSSQQKTA